MTFQFRTDLNDRTPTSDLMKYIEQLEKHVIVQADHTAEQGAANLQRQFGLTFHEAQVLSTLADGRVWSKSSLLGALYAHRAGDEPEAKIIDVWVCKIRKKISGTAIEVKTQWGSGYYVADTGPLKNAMSGEILARDRPEVSLRRPKGDKPNSKRGYLLDMARTTLRRWADSNGVVRCQGVALSRACQNKTAGSNLIRRLAGRGEIKIVSAPRPGPRGEWVLRLK